MRAAGAFGGNEMEKLRMNYVPRTFAATPNRPTHATPMRFL